MRFIQELSAGLYRGRYREERFVPIDPFKLHFRVPFFSKTHDQDQDQDQEQDQEQVPGCCGNAVSCLPLPISLCTSPASPLQNFISSFSHFATDVLPRQAYLHALLRIPSLYFSRVARVFEDAEVSRPDIQKMIDACSTGVFANGTQTNVNPGGSTGAYAFDYMTGSVVGSGVVGPPMILPYPEDWRPPAVSPALVRFKYSWEQFIDSLLKEWKTLNLVSALLLSYVLLSVLADLLTKYV
jgi:hypothetical protein